MAAFCCRSCQTAQEKVVRCRHILATCVNVIPSGLMQQEPGLTVSLDAIRVALEELCTASTDPSERAAQAKLMQPVVAQLSTIIMLNNTASSSSLSGHSSMSQAELQRTGAEALLLAVEMRYMLAEQSSSSGRHVPLAALDIENLTGQHCYSECCMLNSNNILTLDYFSLRSKKWKAALFYDHLLQVATVMQFWNCCCKMSCPVSRLRLRQPELYGKLCTKLHYTCHAWVSIPPRKRPLRYLRRA